MGGHLTTGAVVKKVVLPLDSTRGVGRSVSDSEEKTVQVSRPRDTHMAALGSLEHTSCPRPIGAHEDVRLDVLGPGPYLEHLKVGPSNLKPKAQLDLPLNFADIGPLQEVLHGLNIRLVTNANNGFFGLDFGPRPIDSNIGPSLIGNSPLVSITNLIVVSRIDGQGSLLDISMIDDDLHRRLVKGKQKVFIL